MVLRHVAFTHGSEIMTSIEVSLIICTSRYCIISLQTDFCYSGSTRQIPTGQDPSLCGTQKSNIESPWSAEAHFDAGTVGLQTRTRRQLRLTHLCRTSQVTTHPSELSTSSQLFGIVHGSRTQYGFIRPRGKHSPKQSQTQVQQFNHIRHNRKHTSSQHPSTSTSTLKNIRVHSNICIAWHSSAFCCLLDSIQMHKNVCAMIICGPGAMPHYFIHQQPTQRTARVGLPPRK